MRRTALKLAAKAYISWLATQLTPAGRPYLHELEARCISVVNSLTDGVGPNILPAEQLDEKGITDALDWILKSVGDTCSGDTWGELCSHLLRVGARRNASEILDVLGQLPEMKH